MRRDQAVLSWQARVLKHYLLMKQFLSPPAEELDVQKERAQLEATTAMFKPLSHVACSSVSVHGITAEWAIPPNPIGNRVVLYLHGGSYHAGSITTHRAMATHVATAARARVLLLDYRLAPEFPYPAAIQDATTAYHWLLENGCEPKQIAVAGDSSGGGLALVMLITLRDQDMPMPATAVCLSPWTDLTVSGESCRTNARADIFLKRGYLVKSARLYLQGVDPCEPLASPLYADLQGLPPLLVQVGSEEILLSDATCLAERARAAGVAVTLEVWPDMQHEWHLSASFLPEGRQAIARIGAYVSRAFTPIPLKAW